MATSRLAGKRQFLLNEVFPVLSLAILAISGWDTAVTAQQSDRARPRADYLMSCGTFADGDYRRAFRGLKSSSFLQAPNRWIDSICIFAMQGECLYQVGDTAAALEMYNAALDLFIKYPDWMRRIRFPTQLNPLRRQINPAINWGTSRRRSVPVQLPESLLSYQLNQAIQGNQILLGTPDARPVRAAEIVRCIALAMRRRLEIMGPYCEHSPGTDNLNALLKQQQLGHANHWSQAWVSLWRGLALASAAKHAQAAAELQKSLVILGRYDHPLTATALVELGKLAFRAGNFDAAANYFFEASFPAAAYEQHVLIAEAFSWGAVVHMMRGQQGMYPPLVPVASWANRNSRHLQASVLVRTAEVALHQGQPKLAVTVLQQARRTMARRDIALGRIGARHMFQAAILEFNDGRHEAGMKLFATSMAFQRKASLWLSHVVLVDQAFTSGRLRVTGIVDELYEGLLRDPTAKDWAHDPMECFALLTTSLEAPMEHWLELSIERREFEKAIQITDRIRRHRFYRTLPVGGRMLAFRWILQAPAELLNETARLQRQNLVAKYPNLAATSRTVTQVRKQLADLALVPEDEEAAREQQKLFQLLATASQQQELLLHRIALRREPAEFVFPPQQDVKELQKTIPPAHAILSFFATSRMVHAFMMSRGKYGHWHVEAPSRMRQLVSGMLRKMGNHEANSTVASTQLGESDWRGLGHQILMELTNDADVGVWDQLEELVVVPDGILWYVPFEALIIENDVNGTPIIGKSRVRYAPLVSLAYPTKRRLSPQADTAVVVGKLFPRDDQTVAEEAFNRLQNGLPRTVRLPDKLSAPSGLIASVCQRLVVLNDLTDANLVPYGWSPVSLDRGRPGSSLASWIALPWGAPQQVVLPGFHTAAENGLKKGGNGNEIFLTLCGLMSSGSQTILLSRWRTGGQTAYDLTREFTQELPHRPASAAWQRSVQLMMRAPLDPEQEPRVDDQDTELRATADHPFFWAGYLLVDTGDAADAGEEK